MKKFFLLCMAGFLLASCLKYEDVEFKGIEHVQMPKIENKELLIDVSVRLNNVNPYKIKIKPSQLEVLLNDKFIGTVFLDDKLVIHRKSEELYTTQLRATLADGAMFSLMGMALKKEVTLQLKGKVKGSIYGFSRKFDVDEKRKIDPSKLKLDFLKP